MFDDVEPRIASIGKNDLVGSHAKDASDKAFARGDDFRLTVHNVPFVQQRSSILAELGWLAYFLAVFALLVYVFNIFVVPHHFNYIVANVLAGGVAAIVMIVTRTRWRR
jgi:preprotein translocase subunit SecF